MRFLVILLLITTILSCQNTATTKGANVQESPATSAVAPEPGCGGIMLAKESIMSFISLKSSITSVYNLTESPSQAKKPSNTS